jgi:hypothetical protein
LIVPSHIDFLARNPVRLISYIDAHGKRGVLALSDRPWRLMGSITGLIYVPITFRHVIHLFGFFLPDPPLTSIFICFFFSDIIGMFVSECLFRECLHFPVGQSISRGNPGSEQTIERSPYFDCRGKEFRNIDDLSSSLNYHFHLLFFANIKTPRRIIYDEFSGNIIVATCHSHGKQGLKSSIHLIDLIRLV